MQNINLEQLQKIGQSSYSTLQDIAAINNQAIQKLAELQLKFTNQSIESGVEQVRAVGNMTNYKDLFTFASEFTSNYGTKVIDITRQTAEVLVSANSDVITAIEKGFNEPVKAKKSTVKRVTKKDTQES